MAETPSLLDRPVERLGRLAVVAPIAPIDQVYSYLVPAELEPRVRPGVRVRVPLGRAGRLATGYCVECSEGPWESTLRSVESVLDEQPLLSPGLLELAQWIARYYVCPLGPTLQTLVPAGSRLRRGYDTVAYVRAVAAPPADARRSPAQAAVLARLMQPADGPSADGWRLADLCRAAGCTAAVVRGLARRGWVQIERRREMREAAAPPPQHEPSFALNAEQAVAAARIAAAIDDAAFRVFVLFGVTGSGKTEVYVRAMRHALAAGKQAILLVPEIALTTQTVRRLECRFSRVALLHSGLSAAQRARQWAAIAAGRVDVVIGTRSAVFAPCPRLGVVIVDEEQEGSYKNLAAPRYHTRDVAVKRGQIESAAVVLGSATPSLETWLNAQRLAHYELLRLPRRVAELPPPRLHLVDMRAEHRARKGVHLLSRTMEQYLAACLERREQAVLLLNRRGYASYLFCPRCNTPISCPNCAVFVVFHQATDLAHCHYCHTRLAIPSRCAVAGCGGTLVRFGMGTERVEEELRAKFPTARIARMDSDVMNTPADYADVLGRFEARQLDVLVGTQMIAKGLDFPFVSFVGVVSADTALGLSDFRANERTFQLVLQVAGRSGRSQIGGDAVVQTFNAELTTIRHALQQDYESFAAEELAARFAARLPPYTRLARIVLGDPRLTRVRAAAELLAANLRERLATAGLAGEVLEPRACSVPRLRNQYRYEVLLRFPSAPALVLATHRLRAERALAAKTRTLIVDVDAVALQ